MRELLLIFYADKLCARLESYIRGGESRDRQEAYMEGLQEGLLLGLEIQQRTHGSSR